MVETRSGHYSSPGVITEPETQINEQDVYLGGLNSLADVSQETLHEDGRASEPEILVPSSPAEDASMIVARTSEEERQSLPHRSRNLAAHDESIGSRNQATSGSVTIVRETQILQSNGNEAGGIAIRTGSSPKSSPVLEIAMPASLASVPPQSKGIKRKQTERALVAPKKVKLNLTADHKRFGSEEAASIPISLKEAVNTDLTVTNEDNRGAETESDDDPPEEVTIQAGADAARSVAVKAAKSAKRFGLRASHFIRKANSV